VDKILIANRGEIATRIIRACQELNIKTVAVHSTADKDCLHAKIADESVCIGEGQSNKSYLNIPQILSAAELTGSSAIHPGYGFLAENADFAQLCEESGLKFIGPKPEHIRIMGDKILARKAAQAADIPMLEGSDGPICSSEQAKNLIKKIGFPVIIKASAGGGGRGMKIVNNISEIESSLQLAQKEAESCFGNPQVYIEKYLTSPRHIEVQIVADQRGNIISLGERDCSIQRRHQKIIEEAPCEILNSELRKTVEQYALRLAKSVQYQSVGTIEFLFENEKFYFMEMNTRIQVEHPVTEITANIDLIKEQILISQNKSIKIDSIKRDSHAIECRINAEDSETFLPSPGLITDLHQPGGPGIRIDSFIYRGYRVPPFYDSLIAKIIAYGKNRNEARQRMKRALHEYQIGGIKTNKEFLIKVIEHKDFKTNNISTHFIDKLI
jgi:acetyl-CoA carboxylase, biotin carboxylase subunit